MANDLDQRKLEAEIANLEAEAAKADAERGNLRRSWRDWVLEITKLVGALVLGAGGITTAITGYQRSQLKKERTDFETLKVQAALKGLKEQKESALNDLAAINAQIRELETSLEGARKGKADAAGLLNEAIHRAASIGTAVSKTKAELRALDQSMVSQHGISDYLVGLQTLGVDDATRKNLNEQIRDAGYGLHEISESYPKDRPPPWFASKSTIFYYSNSALPAAKQLASLMKRLVGEDFVVQRGSGLGVDPAQRDITLFAHYKK